MVLQRVRTEIEDGVEIDVYELREWLGSRKVVRPDPCGFDALLETPWYRAAEKEISPVRYAYDAEDGAGVSLSLRTPRRRDDAPDVIRI